MVKDIKYLHKVKIKKEFGKMENSLNGFHDNKKNNLIYQSFNYSKPFCTMSSTFF